MHDSDRSDRSDGAGKPAAADLSGDRAEALRAALEASEGFMKRGLYAAALEECYQAIDLLPGYLPTHARIGEIQAARGRTEEAVEEYAVIARLCLARGDAGGAADMYVRIVDLSPGYLKGLASLDADACGTAADRLLGERRWGNAAYLLEAVARMRPEDDTTYVKLAEAHYRRGDLAGAIRAFDALARVYAARGERKRALAVVKIMGELAPQMSLPDLDLDDAGETGGKGNW